MSDRTCPDCLIWEMATLGGLAREAYASCAMERGLTAEEYRSQVLASVHARHAARKVRPATQGVGA